MISKKLYHSPKKAKNIKVFTFYKKKNLVKIASNEYGQPDP